MKQEEIFKTISTDKANQNQPVKCLGMEFENEEKRREYFAEALRKKLKDPNFKKIEGFPIGEDEDIIQLSDPPYYTACPNPWLEDFIEQWETEKPQKEGNPVYHREPFAADVTEGKNNPIYNAHSYHTKVPHKAIMRYILHYTEPGDIVFDGFCGTGMTGVAAQMCADREEVESLGYKVDKEGTILQKEKDETGKETWQPFSKIGARKVVLNDLSPAATFIAYNYNTPVDVEGFEREARQVLDEVEAECGWMYETYHTTGDGFQAAKGIYDIWKSKGYIQQLFLKTKKEQSFSKAEKEHLFHHLKSIESMNYHLFSFSITDDSVHLLRCITTEENKSIGQIGNIDFQTEIQREIEDENDFHNTLSHIYYQPIKSGLCTDSNLYDWYFVEEEIEKNRWVPASIRKINYTVWSDVFICPNCLKEIVFWEEAVDQKKGKVKKEIICPHCGTTNTKRNLERLFESKYDMELGRTIKQARQVPVLINYSAPIGNKKKLKKTDKELDYFDLKLIKEIETLKIENYIPINRIPVGYNTNQPIKSHNFSHVHHFFSKRNLLLLSKIYSCLSYSASKLLFTTQTINMSKLNRYRPAVSFPYNPLNGTLYVSSQISEANVFTAYKNKLLKLKKVLRNRSENACIFSKSSTMLNDFKVDYLFLDPPFGANINYSELNFIWESWLKVWTNNKPEAIQNPVQKKGLEEYRKLMADCFKEAYRILKPGRWMTVEFSNTKATVWNSIQTAINEAGFIIANTSALDKKQGSFKAVTTPTAVKQDLIISAYKPNGGFESRFITEAKSEEGVWDFVRTHMKYLPVSKVNKGVLEFIPERDPRLLYDQVVAYFVRKGYHIPLSSHEFQVGLSQRFVERDGMFFLSDQVSEYDKSKTLSKEFKQTSIFVSDEATAIDWLRNLLKQKPQNFSEINTQFMQQLGGWKKNEVELDLRDLLNENFLCYDGHSLVPNQIHSYLSTNWKELRNLEKDDPQLMQKAKDRWYVPDPNKSSDLEKMREKSLLREFEEYKNTAKKLKVFRVEAVRTGFKKAWQERDYQTIINIAERIPNGVLEEDPKLLMWYDQAITRTGG